MRIETKMQSRVLDEYQRGEVTQAEVARRFGISRSAVAERLRRYRKANDLAVPAPRRFRKRRIRFVQLSTVAYSV